MKSIKTRIILAVMLCAIVSVLIVGAVSIYSSKAMLEKYTYNNSQLLVESEAKNLNITIEGIETSVDNLAFSAVSMLDDVEEFKKNPDYVKEYEEKIRPIAEGIANHTNGAMGFYIRFNPTFTEPTSGLFYSDTDGDGTIEKLVPTDFSQYDPDDIEHVGWYYEPIKAGKAIWLDPYHNGNVGIDMISYVVPIYKDGESIGVVGMDINFNLFLETVNNIKPFKDSYGALLNANQNFLIHPELKQSDNLKSISETLANEINRNAVGVTEATLQKKESVVSYAKLSNGHTLFISSAKSDIYENLNLLVINIIVILLAVIAFAIINAIVVAKSIHKPIGLLVSDMNKVKDGDLTVRTTIKQKDEIGKIGENFNEMVSEIGNLTKSIQSVSTTIQSSTMLLNSVSEEVTASAEEVAASVEEMAEGNRVQSVSTEKCSDISSDVMNKFHELQSNSETALSTVNQVVAENETGLHLIKGLEDKNTTSKQATQHIEKMIMELNDKTQNISNILETISAIADQTNLLALNASIEAARAGESGKGFSVVAEEIRKLADGSRKATDDIREIIRSVQVDSESTVQAMRDVKEITQDESFAVSEVSKAFNTISNLIVDITGKIKGNRDYIRELNKNISHLDREIENISTVSEESAASSKQVAVTMQEQAKDLEKILVYVGEMNQLVHHLNELVAKFKI